MGKKIERKQLVKYIDLSGLPRTSKGINWKESVGCKVKFIYENIQDELEIIKLDMEILTLRYNNKDFDMSIDSFRKCSMGKLLGKRTIDFKMEIGTRLKNNNRDITILDRKYIKNERGQNKKYYKYKCNNKECNFECGEHYKNGEYKEELWVEEGSLLKQKSGCSACCPTPRIVVQGVNDMYTTDQWMIKLGVDEQFAKTYTSSTHHKCKVKCPCCGNEKYIEGHWIYGTRSIACSKCGDGFSIPNKIMFNLLQQLNMEFETEYSPNWCKYELKNKYKKGRYDFYFKLSDRKYIIEMDGGFHKQNNNISGQTKEESQAIDDYKDKLAEEHEIKVIRIDCDYRNYDAFKYIKDNILLNGSLNNLFDLKNIDWLKCEEFTMTNIKKMICEYWNNKEEWETVTSIHKKFNIGRTATLNYLNQGTKLGWCNYDGRKELTKSNKKNGHLSTKQIEIFDKNENSLGIFNSVKVLSEQSLELFGIQLNRENISAVARGRRPHHKGYTFKYVNKADNQQSQTIDVTTQPNSNQEQSA